MNFGHCPKIIPRVLIWPMQDDSERNDTNLSIDQYFEMFLDVFQNYEVWRKIEIPHVHIIGKQWRNVSYLVQILYVSYSKKHANTLTDVALKMGIRFYNRILTSFTGKDLYS